MKTLCVRECDSWNNDSAFAQIFSVTLLRGVFKIKFHFFFNKLSKLRGKVPILWEVLIQ